MKMRFYIVSIIAVLTNPTIITAQQSFDSGNGCLNVIKVASALGIGEYGDKCISAHYIHEVFLNEQFTIGGGIGYSHHDKYGFSAIPVYLSTHYFFLDKRISPFINLRVGGFGMFGKKNENTNQKYSLSNKQADFNLFLSPTIGVKVHLTPNIGLSASISDDEYLIKAYDTHNNNYRTKLIHSLGMSLGVCFQIKGW